MIGLGRPILVTVRATTVAIVARCRDHGWMTEPVRLTRYARGGGCACKIPPGELEIMVAGLGPATGTAELLVGLDHGDDAAVVRLDERTGLVSTADFFTPVVDDAYDWGRIAAANALSDVYAMGGTPLVALNLLCWPRDVLPMELAARSCAEARTWRGRPAVTWPAGTAWTTTARSTASRSPARSGRKS